MLANIMKRDCSAHCFTNQDSRSIKTSKSISKYLQSCSILLHQYLPVFNRVWFVVRFSEWNLIGCWLVVSFFSKFNELCSIVRYLHNFHPKCYETVGWLDRQQYYTKTSHQMSYIVCLHNNTVSYNCGDSGR